ncbi:MAG: nitrilase-related carbon-nitrogen hydrolase, partial [Oscillospiraceae bacterium]
MEHGFIKVAAMSPDLRVSDCDYNAQKIIEAIGFANKHEVKLLCFPKLCVTGATCEDLFFQSSLQDGALTAVLKIAEASADLQMVVIIGAPIILNNKLYDCEIVVYNGSVIAVVPTIGSSRQFSVPKDEDSLIMIDNRTVPFSTKLSFRATACKDFSFGFDEASNIILCPFAEFETVSAENDRRLKAQYLSHALRCGYIMSGAAAGESSTNGVFSGHQIIAENGEILSESLPFGKMMTISEIDVKKIAALRLKSPALPDDKLGCYNILELDIRISRTALTRYIPANPFVPQ